MDVEPETRRLGDGLRKVGVSLGWPAYMELDGLIANVEEVMAMVIARG